MDGAGVLAVCSVVAVVGLGEAALGDVGGGVAGGALAGPVDRLAEGVDLVVVFAVGEGCCFFDQVCDPVGCLVAGGGVRGLARPGRKTLPDSSGGEAAIARVILSVETVTARTPGSSRLSSAMISVPLADFSIRIVWAAAGPAALDPGVGGAHRVLGRLQVRVAGGSCRAGSGRRWWMPQTWPTT